MHYIGVLKTLLGVQWTLTAILPPVLGSPVVDRHVTKRKFELTLTLEKHAPDGFEREMILVNGQFPGPLIEIDQGDEVEIMVHNMMQYNTTIHYHGIEMYKTPWSDGVPGLTQRQIQPGCSFTYRWTATQYGSYWYHAHQRGQINDGLYGPIIIHPRGSEQKPFGLISSDIATVLAMEKAEAKVKPLVLSDFRHITSEDDWGVSIDSGIETPCYDSILFNGKGRVDCWSQEKIASLLSKDQELFLKLGNETSMTDKACLPASVIGGVLAGGLPTNLSAIPSEIFDVCTPTNAPREVIKVDQLSTSNETWLAIDIIATFGLVTGSFSIDGHPLWVYAVDGAYIAPQLVEAITVTNGDRYSILINLNKRGEYRVRFAATTVAQMLAGYATLSYDHPGGAGEPTRNNPEPEAYINDVGVNTTASVRFFDQLGMRSFPPDFVSSVANQTFKLAMRVAGASYNWALNSSIYPMQLDNDEPLLFHPLPNEHNNVTISTLNDTWVDLIFVAVTSPMPPHPIHKHGNKMWLIGQGDGMFNYSSVAEAAAAIPEAFNLVDPPKRDGFATPPAITGPVWMAVRYQVTNPGAWFMHCHIQSHLLGGMSMAIQDGVDQWPTVPDEYLNYH